MKRLKDNERGASAVEFALTLPFLLAILLGIMEFGWMFFTDIQVTNATRDGARRGAVAPPGQIFNEVQARVDLILGDPASGLSGGSWAVNTDCQDPDPTILGDERVTVQVIYDYQPLTPLASLPFIPTVLLPNQVQANAVMHLDTGEGC